jgi:ribosome-binding factor A
MPTRKVERLKERIRERASAFILYDLSDPRIGFVTITEVDLAGDLSFAKIHVSVLGDDAQVRNTMRGLQDARGLIQRHVAAGMQTRVTPHIEIVLDERIAKTFHILEVIKEARASDMDGGKGTQPTGEEAAL